MSTSASGGQGVSSPQEDRSLRDPAFGFNLLQNLWVLVNIELLAVETCDISCAFRFPPQSVYPSSHVGIAPVRCHRRGGRFCKAGSSYD